MHTDPLLTMLLYFVIPLWFVAGIADWFCHRASDIEHTTGAKESLIHLLMFVQVGLPLAAALIFEVNALIIGLIIVLFFVHEATALWDVSYAVTGRRVSPIEQHVHSFLEMIPLAAGLLIIGMHWSQFLALFGAGSEPARFTLELKQNPLPWQYVVTVLGAAALIEFAPYVEELLRGLRAGTLSAARRAQGYSQGASRR
ncbi:diguanylate cyclase [Aquabacterium sp. A7-Y]|uniref:diguanylate cyclase n=1 Tax=Aquabacterium sp. A7-Y TaxID=1349605 RepID=UPI00223CA482|nr:diguanylate cyclase [Aquabacterium sp. A7-Y]MCW7538354.1 diguanylate cyclase [Aquabacterium sp. A7-Y]